MPEDKYADLRPTPERDPQNSIAYWLPKVQNIQGLKIPRTAIIEIPAEIRRAFYMEDPGDQDKVRDFVQEHVMPAVQSRKIGGLPFIKNGSISNKFDAKSSCLPYPDLYSVTSAVTQIMYQALLCCGFQYDGTDVIAVRERIGYDPNTTACIYNGLPFRPEFRVFYDFDTHEVIFTANYWDKDYVYPNLHSRTDRVVFDACYPDVNALFRSYKSKAEELVRTAMSDIRDLSGPWSIDIMYDQRNGDFWLIDMAVAEQSAYWEQRPGTIKPASPAKPE